MVGFASLIWQEIFFFARSSSSYNHPSLGLTMEYTYLCCPRLALRLSIISAFFNFIVYIVWFEYHHEIYCSVKVETFCSILQLPDCPRWKVIYHYYIIFINLINMVGFTTHHDFDMFSSVRIKVVLTSMKLLHIIFCSQSLNHTNRFWGNFANIIPRLSRNWRFSCLFFFFCDIAGGHREKFTSTSEWHLKALMTVPSQGLVCEATTGKEGLLGFAVLSQELTFHLQQLQRRTEQELSNIRTQWAKIVFVVWY